MNKVGAIILLFLVSCSGLHRVSNNDLSWIYKNSKLQQPKYLLYNHSNDSSTIFLKLPVTAINYKQEDKSDKSIELTLKIIVFQAYESKKINDSISYSFTVPYTDDTSAFILKSFYIKKPANSSLVALRLLGDINNLFQESYIEADSSLQGNNSFMFYNETTDYPSFSNFISNGSTTKIQNANVQLPLWVRCFYRNYPIAEPPFSSKPPLVFKYASDSSFQLVSDADKFYNLNINRYGMYQLQYDTLLKSGAALFNFGGEFPAVTTIEPMVSALRYITTLNEFNKIQQEDDKKEAVDQFWIDVSGSKERARFLIKIFYSRMQNANRFFTSYLEGWKTDRGMIYLIFGSPKTVYRTSDTEYWDYGFFKGYGSLNFSFRKMANPFTNNDYVLVRSAAYEPVWYMAVDHWRQGRIIQNNE
ncbi:MAG TPA: GWxTD domain-containing protein [Bacteroidia bacterium]|nr:GWxTD domain-containing protein [Bacteroidia bacterium]HMX96924.1 GWxTD domain-containing protein [Bacteroidia bacterium]HNF40648.1 GWxTD domain-containing protein [Bacteroidia bacterium]HNI30869.1 GWxTD domain-containing protein [Bacteroidia bacterium]HNJ31579.1 GWxTD domain-containing protein [Bacteroidia bacterium]